MKKAYALLKQSGVVLGLIVFVFVAAAPIAWLLLSSVLQQQALISTPPDLSLSSFTLENYTAVFGSAAQLGRGIFNSLVISVATTALAILLGAPAAYALARLDIPAPKQIIELAPASR